MGFTDFKSAGVRPFGVRGGFDSLALPPRVLWTISRDVWRLGILIPTYKLTVISILIAVVISCGGDSGSGQVAPGADSNLQNAASDTPFPSVSNQGSYSGLVSIQADMGRDHVSVGEKFNGYNTAPATSGSHWGVTAPSPVAPYGAPVRWGPYTAEISDEALVHNLEHGGIGLHYNCSDGCPETAQQLVGVAITGFSQFVISPYSNMKSKIAITAWRRILFLDEFDAEAIQEFINAYLDHAPESVPGNMF